jgi:hypothetical protein
MLIATGVSLDLISSENQMVSGLRYRSLFVRVSYNVADISARYLIIESDDVPGNKVISLQCFL